MKLSLRKTAITLAIVATFGLAGCNDSSDPSAETVSINKTTTGVITGFGSVFINGVEYETDSASVDIDGIANANGDDSGLKLGMVVTLSGDSSGTKGNAVSISFENEIEGLVTALPGVDGTGLKIMGISINTDEDTVFESNVTGIDTIAGLQLDHIVEVSGYSAGDGTVWATRLELKKASLEQDDKIEFKGLVSNVDLVAKTFNIGDMLISYTNDVLDSDIATLENDMFVEVKSNGLNETRDSLVAVEIELKSKNKKAFDFDEDDEEIEVEGVITAAVLDGVFDVNGLPVMVNAETRYVHGSATTLETGLGYKVKVKGDMDAAGVFIAETIVFKPTGDLKIEGALTSADATNNTINLFGLTIKLKGETFVEDDRDVTDEERVKYLFGANDLNAGDWLKVKAYKNSNGELVATKMVRKEPEANQPSKLKGKVESIDANDSALLMVSGVAVNLGTSELSGLSVGSKIELKGSYDATANLFTATDGDASEEDYYIGGEDGEEDPRDEMQEKEEDDGNQNDDSMPSGM